jgi:hypothetical protein
MFFGIHFAFLSNFCSVLWAYLHVLLTYVCSVRVQVMIKAAADYLFTARQIGLFKIEREGDFFDDVCAPAEKTLAALCWRRAREMNADKFNCN